MDLAFAVITSAAFSTIADSLARDIITPVNVLIVAAVPVLAVEVTRRFQVSKTEEAIAPTKTGDAILPTKSRDILAETQAIR